MNRRKQDNCPLCGACSGLIIGYTKHEYGPEDLTLESYHCAACNITWPTEEALKLMVKESV